jgi:hypothetical protein
MVLNQYNMVVVAPPRRRRRQLQLGPLELPPLRQRRQHLWLPLPPQEQGQEQRQAQPWRRGPHRPPPPAWAAKSNGCGPH